MTRARWLGAMLAVSLCGCSTGYNRGAIDAALLEAKPTYTSTDLSMEEIERLNAQLVLPARIAVAPPLAAPRWRGAAVDTWTPEEVAVIDSWLEPLRAAGIAKELIVLPSALVPECAADQERGCRQRAQRAAAARLHADALLVLNLATSTDEYVNPASVLYLSIAGMWVVPATHRDALTITEGVLLDNRNEYLYAFARGEGERRAVRPAMYVDTDAVVQASRIAALESFGRAFVAEARQLRRSE